MMTLKERTRKGIKWKRRLEEYRKKKIRTIVAMPTALKMTTVLGLKGLYRMLYKIRKK
jgi:hypothetical protein